MDFKDKETEDLRQLLLDRGISQEELDEAYRRGVEDPTTIANLSLKIYVTQDLEVTLPNLDTEVSCAAYFRKKTVSHEDILPCDQGCHVHKAKKKMFLCKDNVKKGPLRICGK